METLNQTKQNLLKGAYLAAPLLLTLSALSFSAGITIIPPGKTGYVEGVLGCFALMLFVPVYMDLSLRLMEKRKVLGIITLITGLAGSVTGYGMELLRVTEYSVRLVGSGDAIWDNWYANMGFEYIGVAILGPLFPITSIFLGAGFLKTNDFPKWIGWMLIFSGIGFPMAQALEIDWALKTTYPLACITWMISLWTIALKYFNKQQSIVANTQMNSGESVVVSY